MNEISSELPEANKEQKWKMTKVTNHYAILVNTDTAWYKRLWRLLTNPFTYIFTGIIRY